MSRLWVYERLKDEWDPRTGAEGGPDPDREYEVPMPPIDMEKKRSKIRLRGSSHVNVVDGGDETREPMDAGYHHESVDSVINAEIRTARSVGDGAPDTEYPSLTRFNGVGDAGQYGGVKGEIKRILENNRIYSGGGDLVEGAVWSDQSGMTGINHFYGEWRIEFSVRAQKMFGVE